MIRLVHKWTSGDPGKRVLGWAEWHDKELVLCGLSAPAGARDAGDLAALHKVHLQDQNVWHAVRVFERMVPRGAMVRKNAGDLLDVQLVAGHLGTCWMTPQQWKGDCSREIEQNRTELVLNEAERKILLRVAPRGKNGKVRGEGHNVWSAVGIGLAHLGRWQ